MSKKPNNDRRPLDLTDWRASGKEFEDLLDRNFANLVPGLYAKHGRGMLVIQLADDNSWARAGSYVPLGDLDDTVEGQHAALELIRLYDPETQAVLGYSNEAGDRILDAKVITIRKAPSASADATTAPATPGPELTTSKGAADRAAFKGTVERPASKEAVDRPASKVRVDRAAPKGTVDRTAPRGIVASKGAVNRPASKETVDHTTSKEAVDRTASKETVDRGASKEAGIRTAPMIECVRAEYCQQRVERAKAGARWIAVVPGGASAIYGHDAADLADGALWFCSWGCLNEFALALTQQQSAAQP